jgi:hypothetical protein
LLDMLGHLLDDLRGDLLGGFRRNRFPAGDLGSERPESRPLRIDGRAGPALDSSSFSTLAFWEPFALPNI